MYGNIIVDITHEKLDRVFQYKIPSHLEGELVVGMEVLVPFGRGNRETRGYLVEITRRPNYDESKLKEILQIVPSRLAIEGKMMVLAAWMKENYGGTMIQALKTVLPIKQKEQAKVKKRIRLLVDIPVGEEKLAFFLSKNQKARARLLAALLDEPVLDHELVRGKLNISTPTIQALCDQSLIAVESEQVFRNPVKEGEHGNWEIAFTEEQEAALHTFWQDYEQKNYHTYLIHGVTGSGKTEVYMEMIRRMVAKGRQAIVLIPEIALTYQTVMRFYRCFGGRVSILNSRMSAGERYDQMQRAKNGEIDIMIGPRSALFTPFPNLGLIVIDEEHEGTYKSEQIPRYHARETAITRAKLEQASVVLGSATPSLEAMYNVETGEYKLLTLKERSGKQDMATVRIQDLRREQRRGNTSLLSGTLATLIADRLAKKEQIMLFLNRRGYAGFVSCRECGHVIKCQHCDVSLSLHRNGQLLCHYCGYREYKSENCPECDSPHIGEFKMGTQQVEDLVKKQFPTATVLRMDMDTTKEKSGHEKILSAFANEEADVLIGTQMIVKGHDFSNVTLVGILVADMSLYANDYRCGERTFQLLTQAVGRAGRGTKKGEAVIQTYSPDHYAIQTAAAQDYTAFYQEEMRYRQLMGYPPGATLLAIHAHCPDEALLEKGCEYLKSFVQNILKMDAVQVIGPASPGIGKINDVYRKVLYLKCEKYDTLIRVKDHMEQYIEINPGFNPIRIQFDFNPM